MRHPRKDPGHPHKGFRHSRNRPKYSLPASGKFLNFNSTNMDILTAILVDVLYLREVKKEMLFLSII
jgi:hypothetical protein